MGKWFGEEAAERDPGCHRNERRATFVAVTHELLASDRVTSDAIRTLLEVANMHVFCFQDFRTRSKIVAEIIRSDYPQHIEAFEGVFHAPAEPSDAAPKMEALIRRFLRGVGYSQLKPEELGPEAWRIEMAANVPLAYGDPDCLRKDPHGARYVAEALDILRRIGGQLAVAALGEAKSKLGLAS